MFKALLKWCFRIILILFLSSLMAVLAFKWLPVPVTPLMLIRSAEHISKGEPASWHHQWVDFDKISPHLAMAVIASEDNLFAEHNGFDFEQIEKAIEENKTRKKPRGASTISQQTAKNVFLWPQSSWVRKGLEAYFTILIEFMWDKTRIMEVYLNSIEMGPDIYGAEAVAQKHFGIHASKLNQAQCALIAATLPNPRQFSSAHPSKYMLTRQKQILRLMKLVAKFPPTDDNKKEKATSK